MKWVKVAIGAVIAILSVGIIATSVYNMTQEKSRIEVVEFTFTETTITPNVYDDFILYGITEGDNRKYINAETYINDSITSVYAGEYDNDNIGVYDGQGNPINRGVIFDSDGNIISEGFGILTVGDDIRVEFTVTQPPQLSGISATLILLAPLIFAGGVLVYLLNKQNY